jgi:hypothetical protein
MALLPQRTQDGGGDNRIEERSSSSSSSSSMHQDIRSTVVDKMDPLHNPST